MKLSTFKMGSRVGHVPRVISPAEQVRAASTPRLRAYRVTSTVPPAASSKLHSLRSLLRDAVASSCRKACALTPCRCASAHLLPPLLPPPPAQRSLAVRWIMQAAVSRKKGTKQKAPLSMAECLAAELMQAALRKGSAREKRDALHKVALESRAHLVLRS